MQKFPWGSVISWCAAVGVPMTPLAGTWFGYGLIAIAGLLSLRRGWVWIGQQNWHQSAIRFVAIFPTVLLVLMASVWSYYGGLPALRTGEPATYVEVTDTVPFPELFKPADTTKINVHFANKGPLPAKDVIFGAVLTIRSPFITKPQEDEMFNDLLKNHKGTPKSDLGVGNERYPTIQTTMLSKKESDDLMSENTRLYLLGFIHYRDKNGQQTHEFCRWLLPPQQRSPTVWHLCDGGHNRMVSGDTPY